MDIVELKMPRASGKALLEVLDNELNPDSFAFAYDNIDLRNLEDVEHVYGLAVVYSLLRQQLGEDD